MFNLVILFSISSIDLLSTRKETEEKINQTNEVHKYVGHQVRYQSRGVQKEHNILTVADSGKSINIDNDGDLGCRLNVKRKIDVCINTKSKTIRMKRQPIPEECRCKARVWGKSGVRKSEQGSGYDQCVSAHLMVKTSVSDTRNKLMTLSRQKMV